MMTIPHIDVQKLLSELWAVKGLSDAKIGQAVGVSDSIIWRLRVGRHKKTDSDRAIRIANFHAQIFAKKS